MDKHYKDLVDNVDDLMIELAKLKNFKDAEFAGVHQALKKLTRSRAEYKRQYNERYKKVV